jgi:hypothetical protein
MRVTSLTKIYLPKVLNPGQVFIKKIITYSNLRPIGVARYRYRPLEK